MKYYVIEIHPSDCITPSPPPVRVSAYFTLFNMYCTLLEDETPAFYTRYRTECHSWS
ncbi:hypothetical protein IWW34DRAFT_730668 [Fusarium oxysporum f. sp. albedinis]|nr:hypothetical protein IWW34DRAFT_730668 [Fusarium oxysporum f. sp. albedinis]